MIKAIPASRAALAPDEVLDGLVDQSYVLSGGIWLGGLEAVQPGRLDLCRGDQRLGLWLAWKHVGSVDQLLTTTYGQLLAVTLLIVAALIGFGAYNQTMLMPRIERLRRAGHHEHALRRAVDHFGKVVRTETFLGVGVLLIVGLLSGSARKQAGSPDAVASAAIWGFGFGFGVTVVLPFGLTSRPATFLATRPLRDESAATA